MTEVEKLKKICLDNGICLSCGTLWKHHCDEPFASCDCATGEDTTMSTPYMKLQKRCYELYLENRKLKEEYYE